MNFYQQLNNQNRFASAEDGRTLPNGETLSEHRKHCEAKPGNCPYEATSRRGDSADDLATKESREPSLESIPSLMFFAGNIASKEKAWMRMAGVTKHQFEIIKKNLKTTLEDILSRFPIGVSVRSVSQLKNTDVIRNILHNGFKNVYETGEGGGTMDPRLRKNTEMANFGWSENQWKRMRVSDRPKYGMIANGYRLEDMIRRYKEIGLTKKEIEREVSNIPKPDKNGVVEYGDSEYGRNFITLKRNKVNATFVIGDSMDNLLQMPGVAPSMLNDPSPVSLNPEGRLVEMLKHNPVFGMTTDDLRTLNAKFGKNRYVELQLHGKVSPDAIDEIRFANRKEFRDAGLTEEDWRIINNLGIKVKVNGATVAKE